MHEFLRGEGPAFWLYVLVSATVCFFTANVWSDALQRREPGSKSYVWGYFQTLSTYWGAASLVAAIVLFGDELKWAVPVDSGTFGNIVVVFLLLLVFAHGVQKRTKWGWVGFTILSLNPIIWVVNGFYLAPRWKELGVQEEGAKEQSDVPNEKHKESEESLVGVLPGEQAVDPYEAALDEVESGRVDRALWAKALAYSDGSNDKAKSAYIRLRAEAPASAAVEPS